MSAPSMGAEGAPRRGDTTLTDFARPLTTDP